MSGRKTRRAECPGEWGKNLRLESIKCSERPGERRAEDGPLDSACGGLWCPWQEQFNGTETNACLVGIQGEWGTHQDCD